MIEDEVAEFLARMNGTEEMNFQPELQVLRENTSPKLIQANKPNTCEVDRETLQKYLDAGIKLTPCANKRPIGKLLHEDKTFIEENRISTREQLDRFIEGKGTLRTMDGREYPCKQKVEMFLFYPMFSGLIVLDLDANCDAHANKTDGITNFKTLISTLHLSEKNRTYFKDFPNNFPCYTKTPHDGLHVYFKDSFIGESVRNNFNTSYFNGQNIEIHYKSACCCAGSLKDGKNYQLFGNIKDAPPMTSDLFLAFQKEIPKPRPKRERTVSENSDELLERVIDLAEQRYSQDAPHIFIRKTAWLFRYYGLSLEQAKNYIINSDKCFNRKDEADTLRTIKDMYK